VLHRGLSRAHQDHRQRDHPAQGAGRRPPFRPSHGDLASSPRGTDHGAGRDGFVDTGDRLIGRSFVVRTDGAARGNPGPASAGAVLIDASRPDALEPLATPDATVSEYLGVRTNNVAEYTGLVRALTLAIQAGASEVQLLLDSQLIVEQLNGNYRVRDAKLRPLFDEAAALLSGLDRWSARHVPRAENAAADALANAAIDRVAAGGPAVVIQAPR
jgi:ribonuclease HI